MPTALPPERPDQAPPPGAHPACSAANCQRPDCQLHGNRAAADAGPVGLAEAAVATAATRVPNAAARADDDGAPVRLLIIDDDLHGVATLIDFMRDYDFAIDTATAAPAGLALAHRHHPDLILLDLWMPEVNGFDLLAMLKAAPSLREIPVIMLTSCHDVARKVQGLALGAADYLNKPIDESELHARVTAHLRNRRALHGMARRLAAYERRFGPLEPEATAADRDYALARQEVELLNRARQLLRERLTDPPSLTELALAVGTNQPRLSRGFRALFGTTVYGFVREERLARARRLLIETRWPVKTIALQVGYRNTADLSRGIKERFGVTPTELRDRV